MSQIRMTISVSPALRETLAELVKKPCPLAEVLDGKKGGLLKSNLLQTGLVYFIMELIASEFSKAQWESAFYSTDDTAALRLITSYCRAVRGVTGYGFKGKSKKTRTVFGIPTDKSKTFFGKNK